MAERIPWDEHEQAFLLCALIKVLNHERERKSIVNEVSSQLRDYALARGIPIDEKFRNRNGINLQMSCLEYAFTNGKTGLYINSGWYYTIIQKYKNDYERYIHLLDEVKEILDPYITKKINFHTWIKENIPGNADDIIYFFNALNIYLMRNKTVSTSILQITNIEKIESLLIKIRSNNDFYIPQEYKSYIAALEVYKDYLKSLQKKDIETNIIEEMSKGVCEEPSPEHTTIAEESKSSGNETSAKVFSFYDWLVQTQGVSPKTGSSYNRAVNIADLFARERHFDHGIVLEIKDINAVSETIDALFQIEEFIELDKRWHRLLHAALRKYLQYLSGNSTTPATPPKNVDTTPYREILLEKFPKGFRIDSEIEMGRFRTFWKDKYNSELSCDDKTARNNLVHITIRYKKFVYLPEMMASEERKQALITYLSECFKNGKTAVSLAALYKKFQAEFASTQINNADMLKSYLSFVKDGNFYIRGNYLTADEKTEVNPREEIREYLITVGIPIKVEDLQAALFHMDASAVYRMLTGSGSAEFVWNQKGEYFHADIILFTPREAETIAALIQQAIDDKGYMGGKELTDAIKTMLPAILEKYPFLTDSGMLGAVAYKLQKAFSFKGKIISTYGQSLSKPEIFARFASTRDRFTLEELNALKRDYGVSIPFDLVYANSLRVSKEEFVSRKQALFDTEAIDAAISRFCTGEYIALKDISFFGSFPSVGFPWNEFLLEHYVADFSEKFKWLHAGGFRAGSPVGAIVKRSSQIKSFDELLSRALAFSDIAFNNKNALQYLVDSGLLASTTYNGIEQVLFSAEQKRLGKG